MSERELSSEFITARTLTVFITAITTIIFVAGGAAIHLGNENFPASDGVFAGLILGPVTGLGISRFLFRNVSRYEEQPFRRRTK